MVIPPLIGNPYHGYVSPYYLVAGHPIPWGTKGGLDPGICCFPNLKCQHGPATYCTSPARHSSRAHSHQTTFSTSISEFDIWWPSKPPAAKTLPTLTSHFCQISKFASECLIAPMWKISVAPFSVLFKLVVSTPLKKYSSKWESSPNRGENKQIFETTMYNLVLIVAFWSSTHWHGSSSHNLENHRRNPKLPTPSGDHICQCSKGPEVFFQGLQSQGW